MILAEIHLFLLLHCFGCFLFNEWKKSKAKSCLEMQTPYRGALNLGAAIIMEITAAE